MVERIQKIEKSRAKTFLTFCFLFAISSRVFAVEQFKIQHWKANGKMNLMIVSEIEIKHLQPEKLRNMHKHGVFLRKLVPLTPWYDAHHRTWLRGGMHTVEPDSAVGCTLQSQTDSKMSVFCVFILATSFNSIFSKNI